MVERNHEKTYEFWKNTTVVKVGNNSSNLNRGNPSNLCELSSMEALTGHWIPDPDKFQHLQTHLVHFPTDKKRDFLLSKMIRGKGLWQTSNMKNRTYLS